jgi:hypothetical protein
MWGGKETKFAAYAMPIEYVLEDIRIVCGAKEAKLLVRKEDETNMVFNPPRREPGGFKGLDAEGGAPVHSDNEMAGILGAESDVGSPMST